MSGFVESRVRVRYKETDQMGIAHHSNYIVWFEIGRTDLCRVVGLSYREIEDLGFFLVVTDVGCRYRTPYRYDDEVIIHTSIEHAASRSFRFGYTLLGPDGKMVYAKGFSTHLWLDRTSRKPVVVPPEILARFTPYLRSQ